MGYRKQLQDDQRLPGLDHSKEFGARIFYFGFAVLLYNMWLLVDLLVQVSLDIEHRYKPRVTAKRFLNLVRKQLAGIG